MNLRWLSCVLLATRAWVAAADDREVAAAAAEQAGRLREAFQLYVAAYQALPDAPPRDTDVRLREHIIRVAGRLDPPPEVPDEAQRSAVRGQVLFRQATDASGYAAAETELRRAVRLAPWDGAITFNLALVQEKARHYDSAGANVYLYLLTNPADAASAKTKLYELELESEQTTHASAVLDESQKYLDGLAQSVVQMEKQRHDEAKVVTNDVLRKLDQYVELSRNRLDLASRLATECKAGTLPSCGELSKMRDTRHVVVVGAVSRPAFIEMKPGMTIAEAVALAGGTVRDGSYVRVQSRVAGKRMAQSRKTRVSDVLRPEDFEIEILK